jgi:type VI secretion system protein ImpC
LIHHIVSPHIVPGPDPRQDEYLQSLDTAVAAQMRAILHHKAFQSLEAVWRGLQFLISGVETSEDLQIFVCDVAKSELLQAIASGSGRLEDSVLFERLVTEREEEPWSVWVSGETFGGTEQDLILLGSLGAAAAQSGGPLLASATPGLLGCEVWSERDAQNDAVSQAWQLLRSSPVAPWIGVAAPRFLLRLPYGAATDPIDAFAFEELADPSSEHESFLWGASALACATLIATSFVESSWEMTLGDHLELVDLPAATFTVDGEPHLKPCAEVNVPQRVGESMLALGVMPLMSFKNRNAVRLLRFQSMATPEGALRGPWS